MNKTARPTRRIYASTPSPPNPSSARPDPLRPRTTPSAARAGSAKPRARPAQDRAVARAGHVLAAVAGLTVLAAQRHGRVERAGRALARAEQRPRLPRGQDADPLRRRAVETVRAPGQVPRAHVLHRGRGPPDGPQADELPGAHPALRGRAPLLP